MYFVYIMASQKNGTIYIGQTDDLVNRAHAHKSGEIKGFTRQYKCYDLVWFETHETRSSAFKRERQMKEWNRKWKLRRIEDMNPNWHDLTLELSEALVSDERRRFPSDLHLTQVGPRPSASFGAG